MQHLSEDVTFLPFWQPEDIVASIVQVNVFQNGKIPTCRTIFRETNGHKREYLIEEKFDDLSNVMIRL